MRKTTMELPIPNHKSNAGTLGLQKVQNFEADASVSRPGQRARSASQSPAHCSNINSVAEILQSFEDEVDSLPPEKKMK